MGMFSKFFGAKNEPATDVDNEYDLLYYENKDGDVSVEEGDDVKVVLSATEEAPLLKRTFTPAAYEDASLIVEAIKDGRVAVVCLEEIDKSTFVRIFDYLMGALQALDGERRRVDRETVALLPAGFDDEVSIDDIDEEIIEEVDEDAEAEEDADVETEGEEDVDTVEIED